MNVLSLNIFSVEDKQRKTKEGKKQQQQQQLCT